MAAGTIFSAETAAVGERAASDSVSATYDLGVPVYYSDISMYYVGKSMYHVEASTFGAACSVLHFRLSVCGLCPTALIIASVIYFIPCA